MKVIILYRPNSEHGTQVETFAHDFKKIHNADRLQVIDVDTMDGTSIASLYDVMQFPAVLALSDDGAILRMCGAETGK